MTFRDRYIERLRMVLKQYRNKMDDISELWWIINVRLPEYYQDRPYHKINLELTKERFDELTKGS